MDHNLLEFTIDHEVNTNDAVFLAKSTKSKTLAIINAADDDTAMVLLKSYQALTLQIEPTQCKL